MSFLSRNICLKLRISVYQNYEFHWVVFRQLRMNFTLELTILVDYYLGDWSEIRNRWGSSFGGTRSSLQWTKSLWWWRWCLSMMTHIHWTSKRYTKIVMRISARASHSTCDSTWRRAIYFIFTRLVGILKSRCLIGSKWTSALWRWGRRKSWSLTSRRPGSSNRSQCRTKCSGYFCRIFFEPRIITFNGFHTL